jgi:cob(I)alamin adenosyltransferase
MSNEEVFQAFSALSDAQTVIELYGDTDEINKQIGHAKHHLFKIMGGWTQEESRDAMMPYKECNYGRS